MQKTFDHVIPTIVCTRVNFGENGLHTDEIECERKLAKNKRIARSRTRRNSRRLSINLARSSSSSRSPSPLASATKFRSSTEDLKRPDVQEEADVNVPFSPGYREYLQLLNVPSSGYSQNLEWSENSGDDLSSEWDSDQSARSLDIRNVDENINSKTSGWRKLRNIVHWTPFFQTYRKQKYPWVQLTGHQGNFKAGPSPGTILKKLCPQEEACFRLLMHDILRPYVPEFKGVVNVCESEETSQQQEVDSMVMRKGESEADKRTVVSSYLQLQDLLGDFEEPCVMDCKIGVRTYLESELAKAKERPKLRKDMYEKMVQVDPTAPSAEERRLQGVTKPRYMVWRETISSTATLGFRVEGIKLARGGSTKDFKTTRTREQVTETIKRFVNGYPHAVQKYLQRLKAIRATLKASPFFATHEVVGSSLLFVHDTRNAGIWMIDFAKTLPLPQNLPQIHHDAHWQVGNHEDGYLIGINNLIDIFEDVKNSEM